MTEYSGEEYKTDDEGNYVKEDGQYVKVSYTAVATETFQFNAENGNLLSYKDEVVKTFEDNTTSTSQTQNLYNDDLFNTIAREGNTVYTYDDFGEYIHIESDMLVSELHDAARRAEQLVRPHGNDRPIRRNLYFPRPAKHQLLLATGRKTAIKSGTRCVPLFIIPA